MTRIFIAALLLMLTGSPLVAQRFVRTFPNIDAMLRANPFDVHTNSFAAGYYTQADGGEGFFTYDQSSTLLTNFGTVFMPTNGIGRYLRQESGIQRNGAITVGEANVRQFGARGNGSDDHRYFTNAIAVAGEGGSLFVPPGSYGMGSTIVLTNRNFRMFGVSSYSFAITVNTNTTRLFATTTAPIISVPAGDSGLVLEGLRLDGNNISTNILYLAGGDVKVQNTSVDRANGPGIILNGAVGRRMHFSNISVSGNQEGVVINGASANMITFDKCLVQVNNLHGFFLTNDCDLVKISRSEIVANGTGIKLSMGSRGFRLSDSLIDGNYTNGIVVLGWNTGGEISGCWIEENGVGDLTVEHWGLHFMANGLAPIFGNNFPSGWVISNNRFSNTLPRHGMRFDTLVDSTIRNNIFQTPDTNNIVIGMTSTNLLFINNLQELGGPVILATNIWLQGKGTIDQSVSNSTFYIRGDGTSTNFALRVFGNIGPDEPGSFSLGSTNKKFIALHVDQIELGSSVGGSILFADFDAYITNDVTNFFWDDGNNRLGIRTATPRRALDVAGNIGLDASSYLNWGALDGILSYGFRDNAGTMEVKNSGGAWAAIGGGGSGTVTHTSGALTLDLPVFGNGASDLKVGTKTGTGIQAVMDTSPTIVTPVIGQISSSVRVTGAITNDALTASRLVATDANKALVSTITSANAASSVTDETGSGAMVFGTGPTLTDAIAATSFQLPNGAAPTTDAFGEIAGDNNAWAAGRGAPQWFDGTANAYLVGTLASDVPSNGQVPTWKTGGTIEWETPASGGSVAISDLTDATGQNTLFFADFGQDWVIGLTNTIYGLRFTEVAGGVAGGTMMKFEQLAGTDMNAIQVTRLTTNIFTVSTNGVRFGVVAEFAEATGYTANTLAIFDADTNLVSGTQSGSGTTYLAQGSPTITTPTIASFVNSTHTHQAAAGGGQLVFTNATFSNMDLLNVVANDVLTYHGGGVWTNKVSSGGTPGYVLNISKQLSGNPVDGTTFYIGGGVSSLFNATEANEVITIPRTGTLKRVDIVLSCGTPGSGESVGHYFRLNSTTDTTLTTTATWDAAYETHSHTGLSTAVTAGDTFTLKFVAPTWVTNPATVRIYANLYFE